MAEIIRMGGGNNGSSSSSGIQRDKLNSPSTGSEDGGGGVGGIDLTELTQDIDQDEFDGPIIANGNIISLNTTKLHFKLNEIYLSLSVCRFVSVVRSDYLSYGRIIKIEIRKNPK